MYEVVCTNAEHFYKVSSYYLIHFLLENFHFLSCLFKIHILRYVLTKYSHKHTLAQENTHGQGKMMSCNYSMQWKVCSDMTSWLYTCQDVSTFTLKKVRDSWVWWIHNLKIEQNIERKAHGQNGNYTFRRAAGKMLFREGHPCISLIVDQWFALE